MMDPKQFQEVGRIFQSAVELTAERRSAYLDEACGRDNHLRDELDRLLERDRAAGNFLEAPSSADAAGFLRTSRESALIGERIGAYTIRGVLGRGGMGVVYEAQQENPRRSVAVKVVRAAPYLDDLTTRLIRREVQALARLDHPEIAAIHEAGAQDGLHYFAMERVHGLPLTQYARDRGLSLQERMRLFGTICDAVHYAHQRGVIHRDLKPSNILVTANGRPKVLDFGLARIIDPDAEVTTRATEPGAIMGTLAYMSPEQARGRADDVDTRSDVYSLGVILYELLTDRPPYDLKGLALPEAARIICEHAPPAPGSVSRVLRGDLETIIVKAMERNPQRRYQSASAISEDLERYLTSQPIMARPPSTIYQMRKFATRHKWPVTLAALLFVAVTASAVTTGILSFRLSRERDLLIRAYEAGRNGGAADRRLARLTVSLFERGTMSVERVRQALPGEPMIQAELLEGVAISFEFAGKFKRATELLEATLEIRREAVGDDAPATAAALANLADNYYLELSRFEEAERYIRKALEVFQAEYGTENYFTAVTKAMLGTLLEETNPAEAEQILREVCIVFEKLGRDRGTPLARVKYRLARVMRMSGRYDQAESLCREALAMELEGYGESWYAAEFLGELGRALSELRRFDEAKDCFVRADQIYRKHGGEKQIGSARIFRALGELHRARGDIPEAEQLLRQSLAQTRELCGDVHMDVAQSLDALGALLGEDLHDFEASLPMLRESLAIRRQLLSANHPAIARAERRLESIGQQASADMSDPIDVSVCLDGPIVDYDWFLGSPRALPWIDKPPATP